jgi:putative Mg2+ transporter-C (MgtC) family protein
MPSDQLDPLNLAFWVPVLAAIASGGIIGLERQLRGKPAGIRTCILVCLGTYFFVLLGTTFSGGTDPARVLAQVVSGVGFLGAGVILTREGLLVGVTSAAVIWLLAAIGSAIGLGFIPAGLAIAVVTVVILVGVEALEKSSKALRRGVHQWSWSPLARRDDTRLGPDE